jgi:excisionase family DNA binding protein
VSPALIRALGWRQLIGCHVARASLNRNNTVEGERFAGRADNQPLLDVVGAATHLGCSERFIRRLVQERRIPFVKLGGTKVRFLVADLDRWVLSQRVEAMR